MKLLLNPYFIVLCVFYSINKFFGFSFLDSASLFAVFFKNYFNDFLYIPITLTICLAFIRWFKKLPNFSLNLGMIIGMTLFYSVIFEYIAPFYYIHTTGDWLDAVMYSFGGLFYYFLQKKYVTKITF